MNTQEDNQISNSDSTPIQSLSVGKTLREARELQGLSMNDVANRIKFAPRQIEALEADDYVRLPEAAFVRGFVRSYARLLGLDPTSLLSGLPSSHVQTSSTQEVKSVEIALPSAFSSRRHNIIWLAAALLIAVSLAIFERTHERSPEQAPERAPEQTTEQAGPATNVTVQPLELPNVATGSTSDQLSAQTQTPAPVPQQTVRAAPVPQQPVPQLAARPAPAAAVQKPEPPKVVRTAPAPIAEPAPVAPPKAVQTSPMSQPWLPVPQRTTRAAPVTAPAATAVAAPVAEQPKPGAAINATEHALRIEFDEDAWVEVKDANDKPLVSRMHTAGSLVRVSGKAPLLVIIGNARAVRLFDNGKKINLERYTTAEVARVKLK